MILWQVTIKYLKQLALSHITRKNTETGKYEYISKTGFKRKSDAKHQAEMIERQLRNGDYIAPSSSTFKQVAEDWIKQYANDVKVSSVRAREKAIQHAIQHFNTKPIQTIKKHDYQRFVDDMSIQYSKNYVDSIVASTNMIFKYAYDMKLIRYYLLKVLNDLKESKCRRIRG